jgi:hypothetical protein
MKSKWIIIATILCLTILQVGCQTSQTQEETKLGYIDSFNIKSQTFNFDEVEWITLQNTKRINELHLDTEKYFPSGFYVYNPDESFVIYKVSDKTIYQLENPSDLSKFVNVNREEFSKYLETHKNPNIIPYTITIQNGNVILVKEHYIP